jgi:ABC-type uncharacterized transport system permease subunit
MPTILLHLAPAFLYAGLGLYFWQTRFLKAPPKPARLGFLERWLVALALIGHGFLLHGFLFEGEMMFFGFSLSLSLMVWLAGLFYWIENFYARLDSLQALVMPAATLACALPVLFPSQHLLAHASTPEFRAHFALAMLAYSLFTLASLHALLMVFAERALHGARLNRLWNALPPLLTMERLLFRLIAVAFGVLSLTLLTGSLFSETLFGRAFIFDHKTFFAWLSWAVFGTLLLGRHVRGWRGRYALRWTLSGFASLLLAYVGSRFVLEVVLARPF